MPRPSPGFALLVLLSILLATVQAAETIKPGEKFPTLTIGPATYQQAQIRSITVRTVVFTHSGGMASLRLRDLPPEWQARFSYDPAAEAAADAADHNRATLLPVPVKRSARPAPTVQALSPMEQLLQQFGTPAKVQDKVSLRQKIYELELITKNQGFRPSCAVFAVVSALEVQNALLTGHADKFSEEYLIWATDRSIQRPVAAPQDSEEGELTDKGYSLNEVVAALRAYGIPLESTMHYVRGAKAAEIPEPTDAIITEARNLRRVSVINLPGRDSLSRVNNLIHALNAGMPVPIGLAWPHYRSIRSGYLSKQVPQTGGGHAVTIVGYECPSDKIEDAVFLFKNSWGEHWGQGGYGHVTYEYLSHHLYEAILLEVQR